MAEVIDYLFLFWVILTALVCILGGIYEKQYRNKITRQQQLDKQKRLSQQYNSNLLYQEQQQHRQPSFSHRFDSPPSNLNVYNDSNYLSRTTTKTTTTTRDADINRASVPYFDLAAKESQPIKRDVNYFNHYNQSQQIDSTFNDLPFDSDQRKSSFLEANIPTATGYSQDCVDWVNSILYLFYSRSNKYGPIIGESICRSLNEKLSNILNSTPEYENVMLEFKRINCQLSSKPELTNLRTEIESEKSVSANCKIYNSLLVFDLSLSSHKNRASKNNYYLINDVNDHYDAKQVLNYELSLENLEGKLKGVAMVADKLIVVQFMEKPDCKLILKPSFNDQFNTNNIINEDLLIGIILQTITQNVVDLYFGDDLEFPQYVKSPAAQSSGGYKLGRFNLLKGGASGIKRHIKQDFFGSLTAGLSGAVGNFEKERKILIKLIKAKNINYNQNVICLLELDQPYQQASSSVKQGSNPFWDEHFLFNITEKSRQIVIELWDSIQAPALAQQQESSSRKTNSLTRGSSSGGGGGGASKWSKGDLTTNGKFLGLIRVRVDENLVANPVQKLTIPLESGMFLEPEVSSSPNNSPLITNNQSTNLIGGELSIELLFLEHQSSPGNLQGKTVSKQGELVSIDRKLTPSGYVITTTTITKSNSGEKRPDNRQRLLSPQPPNRSPSAMSNQSSIGQQSFELESDNSMPMAADSQSYVVQTNLDPAQQSLGGRSRSRSRSRSFLRAIKKRFSFSSARTRSRSVGERSTSNDDRAQLRSSSSTANVTRDNSNISSRASSEISLSTGRAKSMPPTSSRPETEVPLIVINKGRQSDTTSALSFSQPKSQLVIEYLEPVRTLSDGIGSGRRRSSQGSGSGRQKQELKYYAISEEMANRSKWRKRGIKLHLFNDHQFVATHLAGSSTCHLCGKVFSRRPGKQGYKCRNCHLLSHKQCHVKVDHSCPYAKKEGLKLEYIDADPPANLINDSMFNRRGESLPRETSQMRANTMKQSQSIDVDER